MMPAEIMVEAFWASKDEETTDEDRMRAALRALAEMPLSETSGEAAFEVASMSDAWHIEDIDQFSGAYRAALLAQAAEGEDLTRTLKQ